LTNADRCAIILSEGEGRNRAHLNWTARYNQHTSKALFQLRVSQHKGDKKLPLKLKKMLDK
jgi:hypothetical protein